MYLFGPTSGLLNQNPWGGGQQCAVINLQVSCVHSTVWEGAGREMNFVFWAHSSVSSWIIPRERTPLGKWRLFAWHAPGDGSASGEMLWRCLETKCVAFSVAVKTLAYEFALESRDSATRTIQIFVCHGSLGNEHLWGGSYQEEKARGPSPTFLDCVSPGFSDNPRKVGTSDGICFQFWLVWNKHSLVQFQKLIKYTLEPTVETIHRLNSRKNQY